MNGPLTWTSEECPLPALELKWVEGGELSQSEITLLLENKERNPDVRIRETCRNLLAAMTGKAEAEPHAQRLLRRRNLALFRSKIRPASTPLYCASP
jgi:hypothetical protein